MHTDQHAWILVDDQPARRLGGVIAWAEQHGVTGVDLLVERDAGVLARRAQLFTYPVTVWQVDGRSVVHSSPDPVSERIDPPAAALDLIGLLRDADVDIIIEHGEVRGEVLGLEVARIVADERAASVEVGVGRHDRDAFAMVHGELPTAEALASVVHEVRRHRRPGDPTHPLWRLAGERWLRALLVGTPSLVGAEQLEPAEPTIRRGSLKDPAPAIAIGRDAEGAPLVVGCSVGVDLDLVPSAADARDALVPEARLLVVVPERDAHPVTRRLAALLVRPAEIVTVPTNFRG